MSNSKVRQGTRYQVVFPTLPTLKIVPMKAFLHQEEQKHDVLILQFSSTLPQWYKLLKTGVPIEFAWSQGFLKKSWIGYVSFVSKRTNGGQKNDMMEVHCLGSSFPLKERAAKVFVNSSIPDAVQDIVTAFGFKYVGEQHPLKFDQLTMAGHSYWEWINEQAKRIGYGVVVDGMTFMFRPLDKFIDYGVSNIPAFSMHTKVAPVNTAYSERTLDTFRVLDGEHLDSQKNRRTVKNVGGIDPYTKSTHFAQKSPKEVGKNIRSNLADVLFQEHDQSHIVSSISAAQGISSGSAHYSRLSIPAEVTGQGDPRTKILHPVILMGTGTTTDGYWITKKVKHMFSRNGNYQVEMLVATDGSNQSKQTSVRNSPDVYTGVVNLAEALKNGGAPIMSYQNRAYKLMKKTSVKNEFSQGWNRTPARWVYTPVSKGR